MQITELTPPTGGGTIYSGKARSTRRRQYLFGIERRRGDVPFVFREEGTSPDGRIFWRAVAAPRALTLAARFALRKAARS